MNVNILVNDCRNIGKVIDGEIIDITPSLDTIIYTLKDCSFDITSNTFADEISNSEPEFGTNSFKIIGGHSHMNRTRMSLLETLTNDVGSSPSMVRMSLRSGTKDESEILDPITQRQMSENNEERKVVHKVSMKDMLKDVGKAAIKSAKQEASRRINDEINNLINNAISKTGLNNVFFRGAIGDAMATGTGSVFGTIKAAINGNLFPSLDKDIANLILNDKKLSKTQNLALIQEILKYSDKKLGNVFE
jgi:hypothetical protein